MLGFKVLNTTILEISIIDVFMNELNTDEFIKETGKQISKLRVERNMTQLDLSIKAEMEENAIQRIERGRTNPTLKTLLKISNGLDITLNELFDFCKK